ncbi:MAG TPA: hypothetical protein VIQ24_16410 [Pyrinomonadaceae bacterium]
MSSDGKQRPEVGRAIVASEERKGDREDRLFELCDRIERGWSLGLDPEAVHTLAAENPDLAEDLYEFFADLVDSEGGCAVPPEALAYTERHMKSWLDSEGHEMMRRIARESCGASSPTPASPTPPASSAELGHPNGGGDDDPGPGYIGYLHECTGLEPSEIIQVLEVPRDVYMYVVKDPDGTPLTVKDELAERAASRGKAERDRARECLDRRLPKAAHRKTPYAEKGRTFSEMVRASKAMSKKEKQYWLSLAGEE